VSTKETRPPISWKDHATGAGLGAAYVAWLLSTARSLGFARDEGFYFHAAWTYSTWFKQLFQNPALAMQRGAVDAVWAENHEHPSLMKSLFALSFMFLHEKWKIFTDQSTAFRFPTMVMAGVGLWVTYLFAARAFSRRAGVIAAVLLALMPRVFYNAHLACFDAPVMTMWALCIYVYFRSVESGGMGWAVLAGVVYGLTLETKHNAWILPAVFIPHALLVHGRATARESRAGRLPIPANILSMATLGPLVFWALWPWLWNDTFPRLQEYVGFHMNHVYYNMEFLHRNYFGPPSPPGYMPVMLLATVPSVTLALALAGIASRLARTARRLALRWRAAMKDDAGARALLRELRDRTELDVLLLLAMSAPLAVFLLPKTPIFGGTKHWLPAYPFIAMFAGRGFDMVAEKVETLMANRPDGARTLAQIGLAASALLGPLLVTQHSHPFGLSSYVPLAGGTRGGASLGLNRQFWGFTTQSLDPYFQRAAPPNATVFVADTAWDSWTRMQAEGRLRADLRGVGSPSEADFCITHLELHMLEQEYQCWVASGTHVPDYVLTHDGVPIIPVYRRK
jgi:4-amino-4-deoxy-L-arabinose transferase-like glycosyltransferase